MKKFTLKTHTAENNKMVKLPIQSITVDKDQKTQNSILLLTLCSPGKKNSAAVIHKLDMIQTVANLGENPPESQLYALRVMPDNKIEVTGNLQLAISNLRTSRLLHSEDQKALSDYLETTDAQLTSNCKVNNPGGAVFTVV